MIYGPNGDPLRLSSLTGQAGDLRGRAAQEVKGAVRRLLRDALGDRLFHAELVAAGRFDFRAAFAKELGPVFGKHRGPCDTLADAVYQFLTVQWRERYPEINAAAFLGKVVITSPPTEGEIEDAWEVEIGSSDAAMRQLYEGSARTRKGRDLGTKTTKPEVS